MESQDGLDHSDIRHDQLISALLQSLLLIVMSVIQFGLLFGGVYAQFYKRGLQVAYAIFCVTAWINLLIGSCVSFVLSRQLKVRNAVFINVRSYVDLDVLITSVSLILSGHAFIFISEILWLIDVATHVDWFYYLWTILFFCALSYMTYRMIILFISIYRARKSYVPES
mmetsp:Transcript_12978/g.23336  ORF Transcript_12978/g.23336 Transcript_12978/m.23336 type:complete len:169 (-) Transcript_12978:541-1047(-)